MSLMELFRNYSKRNTCNTDQKTGVTPTCHAIQGRNTCNTCNTENTTYRELNENTHTQIEDGTKSAIKVYCYRVTDKPDSELTVITHGKALAEIKEGLLNRYGDRFIAVYEPGNYIAMTPPTHTKH